jgi:hypothetical protein
MRILWTAALCTLVARAAIAATVTFSGSPLNEIQLAGPGEVLWRVTNFGGTNDGTLTGSCNNSPGLTVVDAQSSQAHADAFDDGLTVWIDGAIFVAPDAVDVTGQTLTAGPATMSGLAVTVEYRAMQETATLRTRVVLQNPTAAPIAADLAVVTNLGSDTATVLIPQTNSAGLWLVTADDATTPTDTVNTTVFGGPPNPPTATLGPIRPPSVEAIAYACGNGTQGLTLGNPLRVPPGGTIEWLLFNQVHDTLAGAQDEAATFDATPAPEDPLLEGMTETSLVDAVNWMFSPEVDLAGGGPGAGTTWKVYNGGGTDDGTSISTSACRWAPGLAIREARLDPGGSPHLDKSDAFDDGLALFVDGRQFADGLHPTVRSGQYTSEPRTLSGLETTVQLTALPDSPTLRTLVRFRNPGDAPIDATVRTSTNFGSDTATGYRATSSGDTTVTKDDRWTVSSDSPTSPSDVVNLTVVAGPGAPVAPSALEPTSFACSSNDGLTTTFPLRVPPGETRALLLFDGLYATNADGVAAAATYDATPAPGSAPVADLDDATLLAIVNWGFCASTPSLCDDAEECTDDVCGSTGGCTHAKVARAASFRSAGCRLSDLVGGVQGTSLKDAIRAALIAKLQAAQSALSQASGQSGKARKRLVVKASRGLKAFLTRLKTKSVKKGLDAATLAAFKSAAIDLRSDLKTLKNG